MLFFSIQKADVKRLHVITLNSGSSRHTQGTHAQANQAALFQDVAIFTAEPHSCRHASDNNLDGRRSCTSRSSLACSARQSPAASSSVFSERRARPAHRVEQKAAVAAAAAALCSGGSENASVPRRHRAAFPGWRLLGQQGGGLKDCLHACLKKKEQ